MATKQTISISGLNKSFGYLQVLENLNLILESGNFYLLQGSNGQGKSTLLKILATLYTADSGKIRWCGKSIQDTRVMIRQNYRSQLFLLPHETGLYEEFTPLENLTFFSSLYQKKTEQKKILFKKIFPIIKELKLELFLNVPVKNFSQGMKKKLLLCLMNLLNPQIILLDEPYAGLDRQGVEYLNSSLSDYLKKGAIILVVSHQKESCGNLSNKFLRLHKGKIISQNKN